MLKAGEEIAFRIENKSQGAVDVTLLLVDDKFGISAVYPEPGTVDDNRILPKKTLTTPRMDVTAEKPIKEQLVVLAVRSSRKRQDFTILEQPSIETTRSVPALESPLGQLLKSAMYGGEESAHRGLKRSSFGEFSTSILTWTARPK